MKYHVTIKRIETFTIEAECPEDAVTLAFEQSWTETEGIDSNQAILTHTIDTDDPTVEEIPPHARAIRSRRRR